jgi:hypothetical protein
MRIAERNQKGVQSVVCLRAAVHLGFWERSVATPSRPPLGHRPEVSYNLRGYLSAYRDLSRLCFLVNIIFVVNA